MFRAWLGRWPRHRKDLPEHGICSQISAAPVTQPELKLAIMGLRKNRATQRLESAMATPPPPIAADPFGNRDRPMAGVPRALGWRSATATQRQGCLGLRFGTNKPGLERAVVGGCDCPASRSAGFWPDEPARYARRSAGQTQRPTGSSPCVFV